MPRNAKRPAERGKYRDLDQHEAIIEKIEKGPVIVRVVGNCVLVEGDRLLTGLERSYVAEALRQQWYPKRQLREHRRQVRLRNVEAPKSGFERARRSAAKSGANLSAADQADRLAEALGFPSAKAMEQFVKRERKAKDR